MKVGDKLYYVVDDFDSNGKKKIPCTVTCAYLDHAIAITNDGVKLYICDFNKDDFERR